MSDLPLPVPSPRLTGALVLRRDSSHATGAASFDREVARLLRARLRIACGLLLVAGFISLVFAHSNPAHSMGLTSPDFAISYALMAVELVLLLLLYRARDLSLLQLRAVEIAVFGLAAAALLWVQFRSLHSNYFDDLLHALFREKALVVLGNHLALPWIFLIVLYGVFVPNTWRRSAVGVTALALTPLVLGLLWRIFDPEDWHDVPVTLWTGTAVTLLVISAVAVHGSHKIHVLAEKAFEARRLGQYRLIRRLGAGGMGEVYLAEHQLLRRQCAIKLIRPENAGDEVNRQRFEREVKATAELTHPNTVQVYDYGQAEDGTFYFAMEYLPGLTLEQLVQRNGPLPPGRVIHLLRQVVGALGEAHGRGLIHRDVKPGNILVCRRGGVPDFVKLLDFGLVKHAVPEWGEDLTVAGGVAGTPAFMSPEQAMGQSHLSPASDLYSAGAVAYYLLAGRHVFVKDTVYQVMAAHQYEKPTPLQEVRPGVPADLAAVVMRCLEKSPQDRYHDAASLDRALAGCAAAGEWTDAQATAWWDAVGLDEQAVAHSAVASTLVK